MTKTDLSPLRVGIVRSADLNIYTGASDLQWSKDGLFCAMWATLTNHGNGTQLVTVTPNRLWCLQGEKWVQESPVVALAMRQLTPTLSVLKTIKDDSQMYGQVSVIDDGKSIPVADKVILLVTP